MSMNTETPMLDIQSLSVCYGSRLILHEISLQVQKGEILAIVGPNGAGKTTLIRAVSGLIHPKNGRILVMGQDLENLNPTERARRLAVVPQARNLPGAYTVQQTVLMGRTPHLDWLGRARSPDYTRVQEVLSWTNTLALSERRIGELSGGEQQRVLLARALAQNTPILLLDEPTAHLDLQHQSIVLSLVAKTSREQGLSVILAAHDLNLVALYANHVAILVEGSLRATGTPQEVLTSENIEAAYHVPVRIISHPDYGTPLIIPDGHHPVNTTNAPHPLSRNSGNHELKTPPIA
jgi:iron complex transport system ATP-binding protein